MTLNTVLAVSAAILCLLATGRAAGVEPAAADACHSGAYRMSAGPDLVISPSDQPNLRYRFIDGPAGKLFPVGDGRYEGGDGWSVREPVTVRASLGPCAAGVVSFQREGGPALTGRRIALPTVPIGFPSAGETLYGELVLPLGRPRAVVVVQYGSDRDSAVLNNYVQHLLPLKGIATFVFDKRGTGRSTGGFTADMHTLSDDMVAAVAAVRARPEAAGLPLGVMGESQGVWVAPLAASKTPVDFVLSSYGLAVSMLEEDRSEVERDLRARGYGPDVLAKGEALHAAAAKVAVSRFREGLDELETLKAAYRDEPWLKDLSADLTGPLAATPAEKMAEVKALFDFPYDLEYDPAPVIATLDTPQLWILGGEDTEAPAEKTLAILRRLQASGRPIDVAVFPHAGHGMIEIEPGPGHRRAGRISEGYYDLLADWMATRRVGRRYGDAAIYPRR